MPAVSGQFYPGTASGLSRALLELTREAKERLPAIGVVSPHGIRHAPWDMTETSSPRPVWFGQKITARPGTRTEEKTSPATDPE